MLYVVLYRVGRLRFCFSVVVLLSHTIKIQLSKHTSFALFFLVRSLSRFVNLNLTRCLRVYFFPFFFLLKYIPGYMVLLKKTRILISMCFHLVSNLFATTLADELET